mmetsp:Transcript_953/g.2550  ORF Transcript_953/g.2550 Transcript_953/m.2550 type:complete len:355 (+) Transcript_953:1468-2532(+)
MERPGNSCSTKGWRAVSSPVLSSPIRTSLTKAALGDTCLPSPTMSVCRPRSSEGRAVTSLCEASSSTTRSKAAIAAGRHCETRHVGMIQQGTARAQSASAAAKSPLYRAERAPSPVAAPAWPTALTRRMSPAHVSGDMLARSASLAAAATSAHTAASRSAVSRSAADTPRVAAVSLLSAARSADMAAAAAHSLRASAGHAPLEVEEEDGSGRSRCAAQPGARSPRATAPRACRCAKEARASRSLACACKKADTADSTGRRTSLSPIASLRSLPVGVGPALGPPPLPGSIKSSCPSMAACCARAAQSSGPPRRSAARRRARAAAHSLEDWAAPTEQAITQSVRRSPEPPLPEFPL